MTSTRDGYDIDAEPPSSAPRGRGGSGRPSLVASARRCGRRGAYLAQWRAQWRAQSFDSAIRGNATFMSDTNVNTADARELISAGPNVLIAVDDSETSVRAAQTAYRLFGDGARYTVVNVATNQSVLWGDDALQSGMVYPLAVPGAGYVGGIPFQVVDDRAPEQAATDRIDEAERRADDIAREAGLPEAAAVGDTGDPADAIIAAAHDHRADVIVVGTHERNWFTRLFTGSVARAVARDADVPVLIAR